MTTSETSRRDEAVQASRYWLTEQGMAATDAWWAEQQAKTNEESR